MQCIPVKTRILTPPQDDLLAVLADSLPPLHNQDVLCISSKVVAIAEGRCLSDTTIDKTALIDAEADLVIDRPYWPSPLTVTRHTFVGAAGIDESNADDHFILLPEDCFASAKQIWEWCRATYELDELGVIVTDSRSMPFRYGASGVALGWWGIEPLKNLIGQPDLFGREMKYERSNVVDGLAAAANVVMGELAECQPVTIIRDVPDLTFTPEHTKDHLFCSFADDTFRVLYERYLDN